MKRILELCTELDTAAMEAYEAMAEATKDADLAGVFEILAVEERHHIEWWTQLADAWEKGLVPDLVNDTNGLVRHLEQIRADIGDLMPTDLLSVDDDRMLDIAVRMEFFMVDPIFGELLELAEPGGARDHRESYARHLERVVTAIEQKYTRSDLGRFLATILRRTWRDNLALAAYATRDPLTALHNRRGLTSHLEHWVAWASRYTRPLGVILIDVDDFKAINDTMGHALGDLALRAVSQAFEATVRGSDFVARYGGDEFAIVAPETDEHELAALGERLVAAVAGIRLRDMDGRHVPLSVSVGIASLAASTESITPEDALAAADRSLYEAKQSGKGKVGRVARLRTGALEV